MPNLGTLSPSRASNFKRCPQQFKFRFIDDLPEEKHPAAATGNLVHAVLEDLLIEPPEERTMERGLQILQELWDTRAVKGAEWADLDNVAFSRARKFTMNYFSMEDPRILKPRKLEWRIEVPLSDQLEIRGIIDRVEEDGTLVDYKTGRAPGVNYEQQAFFGLRWYSLLLWKHAGYVPERATLMYLDARENISIEPTLQMVEAFEKQVLALHKAILTAAERENFTPRPSGICKSCSYVSECPVWEGMVPPWMEVEPK